MILGATGAAAAIQQRLASETLNMSGNPAAFQRTVIEITLHIEHSQVILRCRICIARRSIRG